MIDMECGPCGSTRLKFLGTLGQRDYYRCKSCGLDLSSIAASVLQDADDASSEELEAASDILDQLLEGGVS